MQLLHVLGAGPWQLPTIQAAVSLGHRVLVTDYYADRPGYGIAQAHEVIDITDLPATLAAARRHGIDGIVCDSTDTGVATAAHVAQAMGLPGIGRTAARACTDKSELRRLTVSSGLPAPRFGVVSSQADPLLATWPQAHPVVVKPVDSQSGKGVTRVAAGGPLREAVLHALANSRQARVLVESALPGTEFIVDAFVSADGLQVLGIARKQPYDDNPTISSSILYLSGDAFSSAQAVLQPALAAVLAALQLHQGVVHAEFMVHEGQATVLDVAARGGGVMIYTHVLPAICGVDVVAAVIGQALGENVSAAPTRRLAARIDFLRAPAGRIEGWAGEVAARHEPGIIALHLSAAPGDEVGPLTRKDDRTGFVIGVGEDEAAALDAVRRARARLGLRMRGDAQAQTLG